jgi:hypothetical protein
MIAQLGKIDLNQNGYRILEGTDFGFTKRAVKYEATPSSDIHQVTEDVWGEPRDIKLLVRVVEPDMYQKISDLAEEVAKDRNTLDIRLVSSTRTSRFQMTKSQPFSSPITRISESRGRVDLEVNLTAEPYIYKGNLLSNPHPWNGVFPTTWTSSATADVYVTDTTQFEIKGSIASPTPSLSYDNISVIPGSEYKIEATVAIDEKTCTGGLSISVYWYDYDKNEISNDRILQSLQNIVTRYEVNTDVVAPVGAYYAKVYIWWEASVGGDYSIARIWNIVMSETNTILSGNYAVTNAYPASTTFPTYGWSRSAANSYTTVITENLADPYDGSAIATYWYYCEVSAGNSRYIRSPKIPVAEGNTYRVGTYMEVTQTSGTNKANALINWYDINNTLLGSATIASVSVVTPSTWYEVSAIAPADCTYARLEQSWSTINATGKSKTKGWQFGGSLVLSPTSVDLTPMEGNAPATVDVKLALNRNTKLAAGFHAAWIGVAPNNDFVGYLIEGEDLSLNSSNMYRFIDNYTGMGWPCAARPYAYSGEYNSVVVMPPTGYLSASVDSTIPDGTYKLLIRCLGIGNIGISSDSSSVPNMSVNTSNTITQGYRVLEVGDVSIPLDKNVDKTNRKIKLIVTTTWAVFIDWIALLPTEYGWASYHHSTENYPMGQMINSGTYEPGLARNSVEFRYSNTYIDGVGSMINSGGHGVKMSPPYPKLIVVSDDINPANAEQNISVTATYRPRWTTFI